MRTRQVHDLKTWPIYFDSVVEGRKTLDLRKNDRDFRVGDLLILREYEPDRQAYTGYVAVAEITHMVLNASEFGLAEGFAALSIRVLQ